MSKCLCSTGLRWLWLVVAVLIIDLGSKYLILQNFALGDTVSLFPSLNLHYARNYGAAFSFLADSGGWQRWFFALFAIVVSLVMLVAQRRQAATQWWSNCAFVLVVGGAIGNLIDRIAYGHVVDFLLFYWQTYTFPAFNIADCAITVGAVMIVLEGLFKKPTSQSESAS